METSPKRFTLGSLAVGFAFPFFAGMELIYTWAGMKLTFRDEYSNSPSLAFVAFFMRSRCGYSLVRD